MTKKIGVMALGLGMILLNGCGGGSDSPAAATNPAAKTVTGVFQDANVAGLNYACSSGKKDVTTGAGEYTCNVGDTVTFSLGGYVLGSTAASDGVVRPVTLYPNDPEAATNVLQLLQSIDRGDDGVITIPENFTALDDVDVPPTDPNFDTVMQSEMEDEGHTWVPEEQAEAHMLRTILSGNTLYTTIWDDVGTLESWAFNEDLTESTWTELVGGSATGRGALSINGMTMTFTCTYDSEAACETEPTVIEVKEILPEYLVVEVRGGELGTEIETLRLYYDEAKAREYLQAGPSSATDLSSRIVGKTVYQHCQDSNGDWIATLTFGADGNLVMVDNSVTETVPYRIEGNIVYSTEEGTEKAHTLAEVTAEYIKFDDGNGETSTFYFTSAAAQAAPASNCDD